MHTYNYKNNGLDWGDLVPENGTKNFCGTDIDNQSPVNLMFPVGAYGWAYDVIPKDRDKVKKNFNDLRQVKLKWDRTRPNVKFSEMETRENWFDSSYALELGSEGTTFEAESLHFHSPSEHTINGEHYDLEMHIVAKVKVGNETSQTGKGKVKVGVISMLFSVENFDKKIASIENTTV